MSLGPWTHLPALVCAITETDGPIVEVGAGDYSTYVISEFAKRFGRLAVTIERHRQWYDRYIPLFDGQNHEGVLMETAPVAEVVRIIRDLKPEVVLIDGDAADRGPILAGLLDSGIRRIVVHDTDMTDGYPGVQDTLPKFRFRYDYRAMLPWTTVVSNIAPITLPGGAVAMREET